MDRCVLALLACTTVGLVGCATPGPYAEVTGERLSSADLHEVPVIVSGQDGVLSVSNTGRVKLEPGQRVMVLTTTRRDPGGSNRNASATFPLNAKPCLRYHFAARHESMSRVDPWQLVLKSVEPIPECVAKYPDAAPKQGGN